MNKNIIHIKDASHEYFLSPEDILWCHAGGNYSDVLLTNMTLYKTIRIKIGEIQKLISDLDVRHSLFRIDRSNIVNLKYITFLNSKKKTLTLRSKTNNVVLQKIAKSAFKPIRNYLSQLPSNDKDILIVNRDCVDELKTETKIHSNHTYVDMALPSGTLWASEDMSTPVDDMQLIMLYDSPMIEVENTYPEGTFESLLQIEEDRAKVEWGGKWRVPTVEEWRELLSNSTPQWAIKGGNIVCILTARNGNQILLSSVQAHRGLCSYWTSTNGTNRYDTFSEEWFQVPKNCSVEIHEPYANEPWYQFASDFDSPEYNLHAVISAKDLIE